MANVRTLWRAALTPGLALAVHAGCSEGTSQSGRGPLAVEQPLYLADHLDDAAVSGSEDRGEVPAPMEWRFDRAQQEWKVAPSWNPKIAPARATRTDDALRITLSDDNRNLSGQPRGGIYLELPGWRAGDWSHLVVRARSTPSLERLGVEFNLREGGGSTSEPPDPFDVLGDSTELVSDGEVQSYLLRLDWSVGRWDRSVRQLGLWFMADEPGSIDILSVAAVPKGSGYDEAVAARVEKRGRVYRSAVYVHAPARLELQVEMPDHGRLDFALGVLRDDAPVTFRVGAGAEGGASSTLFEETYSDQERWAQRSVDLSKLAGRTVTLALEAEAERAGTVALWGSPVLSGAVSPSRPNVIFYVIDGGGADFMSAYGYNRRTTPVLERLAAQGAVFERVYSTSSWTRPSTASFMTSLHNSVMGGQLKWNEGIPDQAVTMAEHMHRAGYQTAVFTANPNAGTLSNLQRGVDLFREDWEDFAYYREGNHRESSRFLNEGFWEWRADYPAEPYWAHFQPTDVHEDFPEVEPFAGLYVGPEERRTWSDWNQRLRAAGGHDVYSEAYEKTGIRRPEFYTFHQGLYDETMAHNDYQLGRLIDRLQATGQWERTLLIVAADHSIRAAVDDTGIGLAEELPPRWSQPMFRPTISRVPLLFVWPGHIPGGRRIAQPVSMIDVLPTVLDLLDLPPAETAQGRSLQPLLLGSGGFEAHPVILDEFEVDPKSGELRGVIEVVDGRWGASLEINPDPERDEEERRPAPVLLYDLWNDPMCLESVHQKRPEVAERYQAFLERQWRAHRSLSQGFSRSEQSPLTPEQLRTLRALGYIG